MINNRLWAFAMMGAMSLAGCAVDTADTGEDPPSAELTEELTRNALSGEQQAKVLKLIDDICGDTWCEGDHNFSFDRLECQKACGKQPSSCKLTFRVFSYDTDIETGPTFVRTCRTGNFSGFASLVKTQSGYQSLQPAYYDALTSCISEVESNLPQ